MSHAAIESTGANHGSFRTYITGFILAIILTVIPFALVLYGGFSTGWIIFGVFAAAVVQILVHLHFFLHLDSSSDQSWNVAAISFTVIALVVVVGGSIWVMHELHFYMHYDGAVIGLLNHGLC